ncbi:MAG: methyl-accepting chemotaxis protein [Gammaproteobacteria bacterium]|nr:methyl-accepting chemotaxis protein [Gammaproteobacteria bacterium]
MSTASGSHAPLTQPAKRTNLGIRGRLLLGFAATTLVFLTSTCITIYMLSSIKQFTNKVLNTDLPIYDTLTDLNTTFFDMQVSLQDWLITGDNKYKYEFKKLANASATTTLSLDQLMSAYANHSGTIRPFWQKISSSLINLQSLQNKILNMNDKSAANNLFIKEVAPLFDTLQNNFNSYDSNDTNNLLSQQFIKLHQGTNEITHDLNTLLIIAYTLSGIGILTSIIIALFTSALIIKHVNLFRQHSNRIASGDLTHFISVTGSDELGQLGTDLNTMTNSLASITKEITQACHSMVTTLEEVRHAVDSQSSGASEQAASINEITASVSEIEKSTAQTMDKARALGEVAERTRERGQLGVDAIEQSVQGMKAVRDKVQIIAQTILDLSNQTQQVGEITAVVNNLAQQSKMLALNASIEAAKAGESGKGFAVVAAEVKNLAEQSEHSTEQVQKILEDIKHATEKAVMATEEGTKGVDHGTGLVEQTGEIIRSLNDVIHETTIATQQIEAAVRQESAGIEQITAGMNEINQVTSTFVESVKQTTEAMANLSTVAKDLKKHIDVYKT